MRYNMSLKASHTSRRCNRPVCRNCGNEKERLVAKTSGNPRNQLVSNHQPWNQTPYKAPFKYHEAAEKDLKATLICNQMRKSALLVSIYKTNLWRRGLQYSTPLRRWGSGSNGATRHIHHLSDAKGSWECKCYRAKELGISPSFRQLNKTAANLISTATTCEQCPVSLISRPLIPPASPGARRGYWRRPGSSIMMVIQPISSTAVPAAEYTGGSSTGLKAHPHQSLSHQYLNLIQSH